MSVQPHEPKVLTARTDLPTQTSAELFRGSAHAIDVSFFINHTPPGGGPDPHRHPYPEVFVIWDGDARFMVDGRAVLAMAGQVIVVPAGATHCFTNSGAQPLEMVSIHPTGEMRGERVLS